MQSLAEGKRDSGPFAESLRRNLASLRFLLTEKIQVRHVHMHHDAYGAGGLQLRARAHMRALRRRRRRRPGAATSYIALAASYI